MSQGHGEIDFDAELARELPRPYCQGNWRASVAILGITTVAVLGFAIEQYAVTPEAELLLPVAATRAQRSASVGTTPATAATAPAPSPPTVTVAGPAPGPERRADVRLVGRTTRTAFNAAAGTVRPSVVGIRSIYQRGAGSQPRIERVGSGIVVDPRGYVVTCHHVVANAKSIEVSRFRQSGERLPAQVLAAEDDLALLRILDGGPFVAATLADSKDVRVGDWILAIGQPFGLGLTVTSGIVGRRNTKLSLPGGGQHADFIQTDAPINEGSSGGPLVNLDGEVIGLNTAIYAPTGVFSGAGFAIPSNRIRDFISRRLALAPAVGSPGRRRARSGVTPCPSRVSNAPAPARPLTRRAVVRG